MSPTVTPETRIAVLLEAHPEAEEVLIGLAPAFRALRNPVLRRTVARVATVAQAAQVGGIPVQRLVHELRAALGQELPEEAVGGGGPDAAAGPAPAWVGGPRDRELDAQALLDAGRTPVGEASHELAHLDPGGVLLIRAPFKPAPLVEALEGKGHDVHARATDDGAWEVWVRKA